MAQDSEALVWNALKGIRFLGMSRDIVSFGFVHGQVFALVGARLGIGDNLKTFFRISCRELDEGENATRP